MSTTLSEFDWDRLHDLGCVNLSCGHCSHCNIVTQCVTVTQGSAGYTLRLCVKRCWPLLVETVKGYKRPYGPTGQPRNQF